ncbi:MAG: hypothetical protein NZ937_03180 [Armatimonadetes bacterium]|nr:hypothetical protein [Armatimonadota bacterium]
MSRTEHVTAKLNEQKMLHLEKPILAKLGKLANGCMRIATTWDKSYKRRN